MTSEPLRRVKSPMVQWPFSPMANKQQDGRIFQKCSRNSNSLPLTNAQMSAPFTDEAAVPLRHLADKLVGLRPARSFNDFFFGRIRSAIGNIFADRGREQQCIL